MRGLELYMFEARPTVVCCVHTLCAPGTSAEEWDFPVFLQVFAAYLLLLLQQ